MVLHLVGGIFSTQIQHGKQSFIYHIGGERPGTVCYQVNNEDQIRASRSGQFNASTGSYTSHHPFLLSHNESILLDLILFYESKTK